MHIPDGILSGEVIAAGFIVSAAVMAVTLKQDKRGAGDEFIPLMGVLAAFIFAGQMLNFPLGGGVSGHFTGAALAALMLGPWRGFLVMTLVLIVQCFGFADGGITALGVNVLNMAVTGCFAGYYSFKIIHKISTGSGKSMLIASGVAAWISVMAAALLVAVELWLSGRASLITASIMLAGPYAVIGIVESLVTSAALMMMVKHRPDLVEILAAK